MKYPFATLVDKDNMQGLLDSFCAAVGIASAIIDLEGVVIVGSNWQRICTDFHRVNNETFAGCIESDTELANQLNETGKHAIYCCKNGLTDAAAPIILEGEHVANFFVGQFFPEKPDIAFFREQAEKFDFDEAEYLRAVDEVPIIPAEKLSPILNYLSHFAQTLAEIGLKEVRRKDVESAFLESEQEKEKLESQLRTMIDSCPGWMACLDTDGNYLIANKYYTETFHLPMSQIEGHNFKEFFPPDLYERHKQLIAQSFAIGKSLNWQDQHMFEENRRTYLYGTYTPLYDSAGSLWGVSAFVQDVSKLKQAEEELRESEGNLKKAQNFAHLGSWEWDMAKDTIKWSDEMYTILGLNPQDFHASYENLQKLIHPDDRVMHRETVGKALREDGKHDFDYRIIRPDGQGIVLHSRGEVLRDENGRPIIMRGVTQDITERKRAEEALQKNEAELRAIIENSATGITVSDLKGQILRTNPAHQTMFGYSADELHAMTFADFTHPDDIGRHQASYEEMLSGKISDFSMMKRFAHKDGHVVWAQVTVSLVRDKNNKPQFTVGIVEDISERRKAEEERSKLEAQLHQSQKLESLGVLAGGIAHDFNNTLTAILGNISLAKLYLKPGDSSFESLTAAEKATIQATKLTHQLLTFSKGGTPVFKTTSIARILTDASGFALHGSNVKCKYIMPEDLWPVEIDIGQINQVFQNLLINANQAMPKGGMINIEAGNETVDAANTLDLREGKYVRVAIVDQGGGIPQAHIEKIFDPFFSTKPEGSGLGLATSYSIVKRHMGAITVDSIQNIGTTFQVYLPASEKEPLAEETVGDDIHMGSGKILIMDDEPNVRNSLAKMLQTIGYEVELSNDGLDALKLYRQALEKQQPFAAVILDLTIPGGMGGVEALERLREMAPDVKAIVSSGYADDPALANYKEYGFAGAVSKPYRIQFLSKVLHNVLTV